MKTYQSWGRYPQSTPHGIQPISWRNERIGFNAWDRPVLPFGCGRSYGDSCLNNGGILLDTSGLNRFIGFNPESGILQCEAGVTLSEILKISVPQKWFLSVTPGTQYVSIGGAIANDVHGKNHHRAGTFGAHVRGFELLRSNGERLYCTPSQNPELFRATIGGMGLTGLIVWAEIQLKPVPGPWIITERIRFSRLDEFFTLSSQSDENFDYTVAWVDCLSGGPNLGRGIFIRGNHDDAHPNHRQFQPRKTLGIPCNLPNWALNPTFMRIFNSLYYHLRTTKEAPTTVPYDEFFYPLDGLSGWNRLYGSRGFLQYQCVIPEEHEQEGVRQLLLRIQRARQGSFLAVLKRFGHIRSPGMMSFPRPGTTLCLDFPHYGHNTLTLLDELDVIVRETDGAVYPAKDARMKSADFKMSYPRWKEFTQYIDPSFSSNFWRRVTSQQDLEASFDAHQSTTSSHQETIEELSHVCQREVIAK